jgi:hypothetical protein
MFRSSHLFAETYLRMWNNTTQPKEISCKTAFDIMFWCYGPVSQLRSMYRTGQSTTCAQQRADLQLCLRVKATAMKNPEEARVSCDEEFEGGQACYNELEADFTCLSSRSRICCAPIASPSKIRDLTSGSFAQNRRSNSEGWTHQRRWRQHPASGRDLVRCFNSQERTNFVRLSPLP